MGNPYKGTFADDEGNVHENSIESLVDRGITAGCDPNLKLYCPDQPITRANMAQFLVLALGERGTRRSAGPSRFTDVPADAWHRPYVERLADLGITSGYPDGTFRPDVPVTRAQMAVFFARTFNRITLDTPDGVFADVPSDASHAAAVEGMFHAGIIQGCEKTPGLNYCPDQPVRRDQMATFLIRALNIQA